MVRKSIPAFLCVAALASAGPIPAAANAPQSPSSPVPQVQAPPNVAPQTPSIPNVAQSPEIPDIPAEPLSFNFGGPHSQYSPQSLRRQQRKFLEQAAPTFQKSPYGSGAEPVPQDSAEKGFGARSMF